MSVSGTEHDEDAPDNNTQKERSVLEVPVMIGEIPSL